MAEKQLKCDNCGASRNRRECEYCGTKYYNGPEIPEVAFKQHVMPRGYANISSAASLVSSDECFWTGGRLYDPVLNEYVR